MEEPVKKSRAKDSQLKLDALKELGFDKINQKDSNDTPKSSKNKNILQKKCSFILNEALQKQKVSQISPLTPTGA